MTGVNRFTPEGLLKHYEQQREGIDLRDFFSRPQHKKLQEIWCAAQFGRGLQSAGVDCAVWVSDADEQTEADFGIEAYGIRHDFQLTEVLSPGRRRGDEYRGKSEGPWADSDWEQGTLHGGDWIRNAITHKARRYGDVSDLHLLIYVNFPAWDQTYERLQAVTATESRVFASVWLMTGHMLCCVRPSLTLPLAAGWHPIVHPDATP